ncbi:MAG: RNA polymerase sigma factor [Odoribacter splanchnicus]
MQIPDSTICSLLNQGEEKGMEYLFTRYYKPLVLWAASFLNNIPQSEDLVQDFFIRLWEKRTQTSLQATTFKSFLYTSVRNLAFDRMEKKDPLRHATDIQHFERRWEEYDSFEEEIFTLLKREIEQLPNRSREIIKCIYIQGLSYKETANQLGISVATVNTLLVNALKKIRQNCSGSKDQLLLLFLLTLQKTDFNLK